MIKNILESPDWLELEAQIYKYIQSLGSIEYDKNSSNEVIARNFIANEMAREMFVMFLHEVGLLKIKDETAKNKLSLR